MQDGRWIKNFSALATSENRTDALRIAEAGLDAIDTRRVVLENVRLEGEILAVKGERFDLSQFSRIKVVGFGKASCDAALALEEVLGEKIAEGAVIGLKKKACERITTYAGTHPRPSSANVAVGEKIHAMTEDMRGDDLVIVIVSGGGSALLCYPEAECEQGIRLYDASVKSGITISELNTVRKHISELKGGGLAARLYPATVIALIFSDVPGDVFSDVASGPTYLDPTTANDAQAIAVKYGLGEFAFNETPKDPKYFERIHNVVLVSNRTAIDAMAHAAKASGFGVDILSYDLYDEIETVPEKFFASSGDRRFVLGAGEPRMQVKGGGGSGGRNLFLGMQALAHMPADSVFVALASDGLDNSAAAGAIVDAALWEKCLASGLPVGEYLRRFDAYAFFEKLGDGMLVTGPTGANVSDLMIFFTRHGYY